MKTDPDELCAMKLFNQLASRQEKDSINIQKNPQEEKKEQTSPSQSSNHEPSQQASSIYSLNPASTKIRSMIDVNFKDVNRNDLALSGIFFRCLVNQQIHEAKKLPYTTLFLKFLSKTQAIGEFKSLINKDIDQLRGDELYILVTQTLLKELKWTRYMKKESVYRVTCLIEKILLDYKIHRPIQSLNEQEKNYFQNEFVIKEFRKDYKKPNLQVCQGLKYCNFLVADIELIVLEGKEVLEKITIPLYNQNFPVYSTHDAHQDIVDDLNADSLRIKKNATGNVGIDARYLRHSERALYAFWIENIQEILGDPIQTYRKIFQDKALFFKFSLIIHSTLDTCIECSTFLSGLGSFLSKIIVDSYKSVIGPVQIYYSYSMSQKQMEELLQKKATSKVEDNVNVQLDQQESKQSSDIASEHSSELIKQQIGSERKASSAKPKENKDQEMFFAQNGPRTLDDLSNPLLEYFIHGYLPRNIQLEPRTYFVSAGTQTQYEQEKKFLVAVANTLNQKQINQILHFPFGNLKLALFAQNSYQFSKVQLTDFDFIIQVVEDINSVMKINSIPFQTVFWRKGLTIISSQPKGTNSTAAQKRAFHQQLKTQAELFKQIIQAFNLVWRMYPTCPRILIISKDKTTSTAYLVKLMLRYFFNEKERELFNSRKQLLLKDFKSQDFSDDVAKAFLGYYEKTKKWNILAIGEQHNEETEYIFQRMQELSEQSKSRFNLQKFYFNQVSDQAIKKELNTNYLKVILFLQDFYTQVARCEQLLSKCKYNSAHEVIIVAYYFDAKALREEIQNWEVPVTLLIKGQSMEGFYQMVTRQEKIYIKKDYLVALISKTSLREKILKEIQNFSIIPSQEINQIFQWTSIEENLRVSQYNWEKAYFYRRRVKGNFSSPKPNESLISKGKKYGL